MDHLQANNNSTGVIPSKLPAGPHPEVELPGKSLEANGQESGCDVES